MEKNNKKFLSIVIPAHNENRNVFKVYLELKKVLKKIPQTRSEIIFVDDGSKDATWTYVKKIASRDQGVSGISLSRNFGQQMAITAGMQSVKGDCCITMDCDLQDPPSLIVEMLEKWEKGSKIVYAKRIQRREGFIKKITASLFYSLLNLISDIPIQKNVGEFRLIDREVIEIVNDMRENPRYLRGLVDWTGFKPDYVYFSRPSRIDEKTSYTLKKMFRLAMDGITNFSLFPLGMAKFFAFSSFLIAISGLFVTLTTKLFTLKEGLFASGLIFLFGLQFFLIWILGEYIGRIFENVKHRPFYIIKDKI